MKLSPPSNTVAWRQPLPTCLRGTRHVWLKGASGWTWHQLQDFHLLSRTRLKTARAHRLNEALRDIYRAGLDAEQAIAALRRWCNWARRCRLGPIKRLALTVHVHFDGIVEHFRSRLSNSLIEAVNAQIQSAKVAARGHRTKRNLITVIYLRAGHLSTLPASPFAA